MLDEYDSVHQCACVCFQLLLVKDSLMRQFTANACYQKISPPFAISLFILSSAYSVLAIFWVLESRVNGFTKFVCCG